MTTNDKQVLISNYLIEFFNELGTMRVLDIGDSRPNLSDTQVSESISSTYISQNRVWVYSSQTGIKFSSIYKTDLIKENIKDHHCLYFYDSQCARMIRELNLDISDVHYLFINQPDANLGFICGFIPFHFFLRKQVAVCKRKIQL